MEQSSQKQSFFSRIINTKKKAEGAIDTFSPSEKIILFILVILFGASSLSLLDKGLSPFMTEVPTSGGTLHEGVIGYPRYINPLLSVTNSGEDLTQLIYSGLFRVNEQGELEMNLAENYSVSEDGTVYTVTLKDNAFFHDNTKVTAYDVEFTIKKAIDPELKSPVAPNWQGVNVRVISEREIEFTIAKPYAPFLENLTLGILPRHIWADIDSEGFLWSQKNFEPIGSGPYKVVSVKRDSSGLPIYYELEAFRKHVVHQPFIKKLFIHFYTSEEKLLEALQKGEIQSVGALSPKSASQVSLKKSEIKTAELPRIFGVFFNQNNSPVLAKKEVREALYIGTYRKEIIDNVLSGFGKEAYSPLPPNISKLNPEIPNTPEEAVNKAITILEKAGWTKNESGVMIKKDGKEELRLSFSIATSNNEELKEVASILKTQWEKIGAEVELEFYDISDLNQNILRPRAYDALLFGEVIGRELDLYAFWHSSERLSPGFNLSLYTNTKVDKILTDIRQENSDQKKKELLGELEKEIDNDKPAVFLYSPEYIYIIPKYLKGVSIDSITSGSERFFGVIDWYKYTEKVWSFLKK